MNILFKKIKERLNHTEQSKIVYRFISEIEKKAIEEKDISKIGSSFEKHLSANTHRYKKNVKYVHFLDTLEDAKFVYNEIGLSKKYLCSYSIPIKTLSKYLGKGFYSYTGYDMFETIK